MNANLGIVLRKSDRETILSPVPPRLRTWGGETVEEDRPQRFAASGLEGVEFELFPVTKFILGRLPSGEQMQELEYAWMTGPELHSYEAWTKANRDASELNSFEAGLVALLVRLNFWTLMFAPEGDRLSEFVRVDAREAVQMLRHGASDLAACRGFLAIGR